MPRLSKLSRSIAGKVAFVTGTASGMGRATAHLFADEGAKVALSDVNQDGALEVAGEVEAAGGECIALAMRAADPSQIERIDMLLMHRQDPMMDHDETGAALDELVASGKVRQVGVSNFRPWDMDLLQSAMKTRLSTNQIEISVLENAPFTNGDIAYLQQHRIPPMAWSPLAGGTLFAPGTSALHDTLAGIAARHDVNVATLAVAWLLAHPARIMPVMGTNNLDRIARIGDAAGLNIDRETWFEIYTAAIGAEVP